MPLCSPICSKRPTSIFEVVEIYSEGTARKAQRFTDEGKAREAFRETCRKRERFYEVASTFLLEDKVIIDQRQHPSSGSGIGRRSRTIERLSDRSELQIED